jgi:cyclopropane-fatty-acyl-phospholipid synthase
MIRQALRSLLPDRAAFNVLATVLRGAVQSGTLVVTDPWGGSHVFGPGNGCLVSVRLTDPQTPTRLLADPMLGAGEAYMDGALIIEEGSLRDFLMIGVTVSSDIATQAQATNGVVTPLHKGHRHIPIAQSRANVAHHYDLSEDLYRLFLDPDMQYSCAYFQDGDESLDLAQAKKKRHIAAKLRLKPGARVLDIGSGWGGLALELAQVHGVEVDGLTLSHEQLKVATTRAAASDLQSRARFHLRDYREETSIYDRIVSVGMFEHVGTGHYAEFFDIIHRLLAQDGLAVIHAIGRRDSPGQNDSWLEKYIFPGGYCPSLSEVFAAVEHSGLWVTDVEVLPMHYAETLRCWSERFQTRRAEAAELYDERFCRMWEFYLAACEAGFRAGTLMVFQIQLARNVPAVPQTRDYMIDEERRLAV